MASAGDGGLCRACEIRLPAAASHACARCGLPVDLPTDLCGTCLAAPPAYDYTFAGRAYSWPLHHLVHAFKYSHAYGLASPLCAPLSDFGPPPDVFLPMPQHPHRLRERGYDQTRLLARELSRRHNRPMMAQACQRTRHTRAQTGLGLSERKANLKGAFTCLTGLEGLHVGIVDDVMTTGSSMQELALALRAAGVARVGCWVAARAWPARTQHSQQPGDPSPHNITRQMVEQTRRNTDNPHP